MKTLDDIKQDMSDLYEELKSGKTELKMAAELANVAGKRAYDRRQDGETNLSDQLG